MALGDLFSNLHLFVRWLHVIAGITWVGHLYFFNFVNAPLQGSLDDAAKKAVNPQLMPRALYWFRWGAMITFLAGLVLFTMIYMYTPGVGFGPSELFRGPEGLTQRAVWILLGMVFGSIMWFNVWFVIWPAQKNILGGKVSGDELAATRKKAGLASKINTYLSGPMLYGMLAAQHYTAVNPVTLIIFVALGFAPVWLAYGHSTKVSTAV